MCDFVVGDKDSRLAFARGQRAVGLGGDFFDIGATRPRLRVGRILAQIPTDGASWAKMQEKHGQAFIDEGHVMSDVTGTSRRTFIFASGAAAVAAGIATAVPGLATTGGGLAELDQKVVVTVVDPAKGVFNVMWGEHQVQVTDPTFASKLSAAIA